MKRKPQASLIALLGAVAISTALTIALFVFAVTGRIQVSSKTDAGAPTTDGRIMMFSQPPELGDFREITLIGKWRAEFIQGRDRRMELSWPQSYGNQVRWKIREDRLELEFDPPFLRDAPGVFATATITMPELGRLELEGYNQVRLQGFEGDRLTLSVKGNNLVEGDGGYYAMLELLVAGMNQISLGALPARGAEVHIQGNNGVTLSMDGGTLSGFIAGVGTLEYHGTVSAETVHIAGVAHVGRLD